jgi:hypothetical protein
MNDRGGRGDDEVIRDVFEAMQQTIMEALHFSYTFPGLPGETHTNGPFSSPSFPGGFIPVAGESAAMKYLIVFSFQYMDR